MKRLFNLFAIGLLLAACDMEQQEPQVKVQSTYSVECASYDFTDENGIATKSVIGVDKSGSDGSQKVSNWNIWVYDHSTGNIVNNGGKNIYDETMMTFFRKTSGIDGDLLFPDENGHYDIYILTNVEQITSVPATASAAAAYSYTFENYNSFKPENGGFPMATVESNFCPATAASHTFMVKRLVSKYDVVIVNDIPDSEFILSSVKLKQGAKKINPFQENSKISLGTEAGEDYDMFKVSELVKKDAVTYIGELYMLENNQGQVFNSSVSTDKERIPDNMINPQNGELCTFVEFAGNIAMKDGHGQNNIKFRHYFGSGRNAGVMRNINTTVTLTLKTCPNDSDEDWRIVPEDPYDTRTVVFNPNPVEIVADGSWYDVTVTPKAGDPLVLNNYIEYRLECPDASSASLSFDGVTMGSTVSGQKILRIKSNYSGSTPTTVKLYAYIGDESSIPSDTLNINIQKPAGPENATLEFVWSSSFDPNNDTQWYYSVNNGTIVYVPFSTDEVSLGMPVSSITTLKVGVKSSRFFADYDEKPEDDDMYIGLYQDEVEIKSKTFIAGNKKDMYLSANPSSAGGNKFDFIVADPGDTPEPVEPIDVYLDFYADGGSSDMGLNEIVDTEYLPTASDYYGLHLYAVKGSGYRWGLSGYSIFGQPGTENSRHQANLMCSLKGNFWDQFIIDSEDEEQDESDYGFELEHMSSISSNEMYDFSTLSGNNMTKFTRDFNPYENHTWLMYFDTKVAKNTARTEYYIKVIYNCYDTEQRKNVSLNTGEIKTYVKDGVPGSGCTVFYDNSGDYASMNVYTYTSPTSGGIGAIQRGPDIPFTTDGYKLASKYELKSITVQLSVESR